ncbi:MAG TPA: Ig-like domain-containing protein [Candidatus Ozemobacteraceae bacterium]|nr:Ig-like domain-containing protein [Candidatus Ozemobacteraceae bacterium]
MNLLPKPVDKHVAALSAALLLSAFLLMLGSLGCRIIEPFWSANRDGDGIAGLIGRYTVAGGAPLDIRSGDLRVTLPAGAAPDGTSLTLVQVPEPMFVGSANPTGPRKVEPPAGFVKLSSAYDITISPAETVLSRPARLELPYRADDAARIDPGIIRVACQRDASGWVLFIPAIDPDHQLAIVETFGFSRWMVVRPTVPTVRLPSLHIAAQPGTLISTVQGAFDTDVALTFGAEAIDSTETAINELTIAPVNGPLPPAAIPSSPGQTSALPLDDQGKAALALGTSPLISRATAGDAASFTLRLATSGLRPSGLASRLILRWIVKRTDGISFAAEAPFTLQSASVPDLPPPLLTVHAPAAEAVDVPLLTPIELTFDQDMDKTSVAQALRVTPANTVASVTWTDARHAYFQFDTPWPEATLVTVTLATAARSLAGIELAGPVTWTFTTVAQVDQIPPQLVTIVPASGSQALVPNTRIRLTFSKPMLRSSVEEAVTVVPAAAGMTFDWSTDNRTVGLLPSGNWAVDTDHLVTLAPSACDTDGLTLAAAVGFRFRTGTVSGPTVSLIEPVSDSIVNTIPSSLEFLFSRSMNQALTEEAFSVSPKPSGAPAFVWASSSQELTVSWTTPFPDAVTVTASFSAAARDLQNLPLSGTLSFGFRIPDLTPPQVVSAYPAEGAAGIARNAPVELEFSEPMNPTSVANALLVTPSGDGIRLTWDPTGTRLTVAPAALWPGDTPLTITFGTGASDKSGNPLSSAFSLAFRTSAVEAPVLSGSTPRSGASGILPGASLQLTFSRPMETTSLAGALMIDPAPTGGVSTAWSGDGSIATLTPLPAWANGATITIRLTPALRSAEGTGLAATTTITFTTADTEPPAIVSLLPATGTERVSTTASVTVVFSEPMLESSVQAAVSMIPAPGGSLRMRSLDAGRRFEFSWASPLTDLTAWKFTIGTGARDRAGNPLRQSVSTGFTTTDTSAPAIVSTWPEAGSTGIPTGTALLVDFTEAMAPLTVQITFSPTPPGSPQRSWSSDGRRLTLSWPDDLLAGTTYEVEIATDAQDPFGNPLSAGRSFSFTTLAPEQPAAPVVSSLVADPSTAAANPDRPLRILFGQAMDEASVIAAISFAPALTAPPVPAWNADKTELTLTFAPAPATEYTFQIDRTARSAGGITLGSPYRTSFTTAPRPSVLAGQELPVAGSFYIASNTSIQIPFSRTMNTASVEAAFSLQAGGSPIAGTFGWEGNRLTFTPSAPLSAGILHATTLLSSAEDTDGVRFAGDWTATFTTAPPVAPTIVSTVPANGATEVPTHQAIVFEFSAPMATSTVLLTVTPAPIGQQTREWSPDQKRLTVSSTGGFGSGTTYQASVAAGARDTLGTALSGATSIAFTAVTTAAPRILSVVPGIGAREILRTSGLTLTFDQAMSRATAEAALTLSPAPSGAVTFAWSAGDTVLTASWTGGLTLGTAYTVRMAATAESVPGVPLGTPFSSFFTVESSPIVVAGSAYPAPGAVQIATGSVVRMTFSKPMQTTTVASAFQLKADGISVPGSFAWSGETVTFTPAAPLPASGACVVSVSTAALDTSGNPLAAPVTWRFDTVTTTGTLWTQLLPNDFTATERFGVRRGHATISFNNRLWVIGGSDGFTFFNDVWSSADGVTWQQELAHTETPGASQFGGRTNHACAVFNNRIWLTGGYIDTGTGLDVTDDVWSSADGVIWRLESASAEYWARGDHQMLVFDGKLWILAGQTYDTDGRETLLGDTWASSDGITWTERGMTTAYFPRRLAAAGVIGNAMFIWGGYGTDAVGAAGPRHDIWRSVNGDQWSLVTTAAPFAARSGAAHTVLDGTAWMIGGYGIGPSGFDDPLNDVWSSRDGVTWNLLLPHDESASGRFSPRRQAGLGQIAGSLFLIGGEERLETTNDVWKQE